MTPQAELLASAIAAAERALEPFARAWKQFRHGPFGSPGPHNRVEYEDFERAAKALRQLREAQK
jgi:hypothetical protein